MSATAQSQPTGFLARRFRLAERGTNPRTEVLGGVATFLTMCYILFVNPAILSAAGIPFAAGIGLGVIGYVVVMAATGRAPRHPPADVGHRPVLRRGLARSERVLRLETAL
jgi:adenine/guanine/hypoxanthine permease